MKALASLAVLGAAVASHAQFDLTVNPLPIRDEVTFTTNIAVPYDTWLPGRNGATVATGTFRLTLENRRTRRQTVVTESFTLKKTGGRTAFGTEFINWNNTDFKLKKAEIQVVLRSNGVSRIVRL